MDVDHKSQLIFILRQEVLEGNRFRLGESTWPGEVSVTWVLVCCFSISNLSSYIVSMIIISLEIHNIINLAEVDPEIPVQIDTSVNV